MCHYKREQKNNNKKQQKNKSKNKKQNKKPKKRSKLLISVLEEVVKISVIIFESHQRGSSAYTSSYQMEALNLTKMNLPRYFSKDFVWTTIVSH